MYVRLTGWDPERVFAGGGGGGCCRRSRAATTLATGSRSRALVGVQGHSQCKLLNFKH